MIRQLRGAVTVGMEEVVEAGGAMVCWMLARRQMLRLLTSERDSHSHGLGCERTRRDGDLHPSLPESDRESTPILF